MAPPSEAQSSSLWPNQCTTYIYTSTYAPPVYSLNAARMYLCARTRSVPSRSPRDFGRTCCNGNPPAKKEPHDVVVSFAPILVQSPAEPSRTGSPSGRFMHSSRMDGHPGAANGPGASGSPASWLGAVRAHGARLCYQRIQATSNYTILHAPPTMIIEGSSSSSSWSSSVDVSGVDAGF